MRLNLLIGEKRFRIDGTAGGQVSVNGSERSVDFRIVSDCLYSLLIDGHSYEVWVSDIREGYRVEVSGHEVLVREVDQASEGHSAKREGTAVIFSPMPGRVIGVKASEGESVETGQGLIIIEAMKMENELTSPRGGKISKIAVVVGDKVEAGQELVTIE